MHKLRLHTGSHILKIKIKIKIQSCDYMWSLRLTRTFDFLTLTSGLSFLRLFSSF